MPSERISKRISAFLDEAESALAENDWELVIARCIAVLALDPGNADAEEYIAAAQRASVGLTPADEVLSEQPLGEVSLGSQTSSRYEIEKFLGEGGKKKVYLAHDKTLDRPVAFAQIKTEDLDETGRERIKREAQAMGRMGNHPHIMPIYDLGDDRGQPFMVQPVMEGGDVEGLIKDADGPLPLDMAIRIGIETARGLAFAHERGVVHRDLKPGNIWLDANGTAKIGDFGLAVATDRSRLTVEKVMVGTVAYMPPEQATGADVTPQADLYSLGAMLYEMCTGRIPFMGDDDIAIISQHINTPPVAPSWHNRTIPKTLSTLIMRLLAKDPSERPSSANEVISALESVELSAVDDVEGDPTNLDNMAGGVFVGRQREMDQLKSTFEEVLAGHGHMVTLVGEPGIGKTRTAQELATYARMRGAQVVWGVSYEGGGEPPYWPWVRAMRELVAVTEPALLRTQLGAVASVIADLVPDVRSKLPEIPHAIEIDSAESARFRLFDSVATYLKSAAVSQPIVIMLEDLHWSDQPSLQLLEFLARELSNSRLMVVGNYRDVELSRRHPLAITLGELGRERRFERVLLRGLQRHDISRFIEIAAGITPAAALVDAVHIQTEGNPLFVTETVRLLVQEGDIKTDATNDTGTTTWQIRIPEGVREVIGRRLDRLSERCNEVLTTAAVIGRQFRFQVLLNLVDSINENMLLDVLDEALSSRILEEIPTEIGLYQFTHALMQETLTSELSANRIVRMHARIAEALEGFYGEESDQHAGELCAHFAEAETVLGPAKIVRYALIAGEGAASSFAWAEALNQFQRALTAKESGTPTGREQHVDAELATILRHLRKAQSALLMSDQAELTLRRLFEHYVLIGNYSDAISVLCEHDAPPQDLVERALELTPPDSHDAGKLLAWRGRILGIEGDLDGAEDAFYNAMAIAQREDDQALALRIMINGNEVDLVSQQYGEDAVAKGRRYVDVARRAHDKTAEAEAHMQTAWSALYIGDPETADQHAEEYESLASELGLRSHKQTSLVLSSAIAHSIGQLDLSRELAVESSKLGEQPEATSRLAEIELELGNPKPALELLAELSSFHQLGSGSHDSRNQAVLDESHVLRLTALACQRGSQLPPGCEAHQIIQRSALEDVISAMNTGAVMAWVIIKVHLGDRQDLEVAVDALRNNERIYVSPFSDVGHVIGLAESLLGEHDAAESHFNSAVDRSKRAGYRPELAWTLFDQADMLLKRDLSNDKSRAWDLQSEAMEIANSLGMKPLVRRIVSSRNHVGA